MKQDFSETLVLEGIPGTIASGQTFPWGMVEKEVAACQGPVSLYGQFMPLANGGSLAAPGGSHACGRGGERRDRPKPVHPNAIWAMQEIDVDISAQRSKSLQTFLEQDFDYVITLCDDAQETCPSFPGTARHLHWPLTDPAAAEGTEKERLEAFRSVRHELSVRIEGLFPEIFDRLLERTYNKQR